jgi:hypothetical protein
MRAHRPPAQFITLICNTPKQTRFIMPLYRGLADFSFLFYFSGAAGKPPRRALSLETAGNLKPFPYANTIMNTQH